MEPSGEEQARHSVLRMRQADRVKGTQAHRKNIFVPELESLRGIAALFVVFGHSFGLLVLPPPYSYGNGISPVLADLIKTLTNSIVAVFIFFVLSGLVLSFQLRDYPLTIRGYAAYVTRRLTRLMIPLWAVLPLGYLSWWYNGVTPSLEMVLKNLFLIDVTLNQINWSMQVEVLMSVAFPFMFFVFRYSPVFIRLLTLIVLYLGYAYGVMNQLWQYAAMFYAGMLISVYYSYFLKLKEIIHFVILFAGLLFIFIGYVYIPTISHFGYVFGATLLVTFVMANSGSISTKFLRLPAIRFLGKCSYMIYLLHWSILFMLRRSLGDHFQFWINHPFVVGWIMFISTVLITLPLAFITHRLIEIPAVKLSKYLSGLIDVPKAGELKTADLTS